MGLLELVSHPCNAVELSLAGFDELVDTLLEDLRRRGLLKYRKPLVEGVQVSLKVCDGPDNRAKFCRDPLLKLGGVDAVPGGARLATGLTVRCGATLGWLRGWRWW